MIIGAALDSRLGLDFATLRGLGADAAALGFESVWTPSGGVPDGFHLCAAWAQETARLGEAIATGIAVVPGPPHWTPGSLALQGATVGLISGGRFTLGIGTGGAGEAYFAAAGLPNRPITIMREYLESTRTLLRGEVVTRDNAIFATPRIRIDRGLPTVPVVLAALGPQMLRLAGESADGASLNWATPAHIAQSRETMNGAAVAAGRDPSELKLSMYIRVCVDEDIAAARPLAEQVLAYAMARPGIDPSLAYRGLFAQMGFDAELRSLAARRDGGLAMAELTTEVSDELLSAVGYYGPPDGAARHFSRLAVGLDEALVRVITTVPSAEKVRLCLEALTPASIRSVA